MSNDSSTCDVCELSVNLIMLLFHSVIWNGQRTTYDDKWLMFDVPASVLLILLKVWMITCSRLS